MNTQELLDAITCLPQRRSDVPTPPPIELVALMVRWNRSLRQWKASTLADFAQVSVSSVERIERGEKVTDEVLDKIALAFGYNTGHFTKPRIPLSEDEAELCRKIGDGVNQAADLISATASIPSLNFIPLTTFGNWF
jgi:transcriptional regulator with XRE-family HTH domain